MRENHSSHQSHFESMERDNQRHPMASHQSTDTSESVAKDWQSGVYEMKKDAMDEAYGMAGKRDVEKDFSKAHSQFREYNWS